MKKHLCVKIYGIVQGVFFRQRTRDMAEEMGVNGFVRNEPDGNVYVEAEGEEKNLNDFLDRCRQGFKGAKVDRVEYQLSSKLKYFKNFTIQY
jgi:acylphosphatase